MWVPTVDAVYCMSFSHRWKWHIFRDGQLVCMSKQWELFCNISQTLTDVHNMECWNHKKPQTVTVNMCDVMVIWNNLGFTIWKSRDTITTYPPFHSTGWRDKLQCCKIINIIPAAGIKRKTVIKNIQIIQLNFYKDFQIQTPLMKQNCSVIPFTSPAIESQFAHDQLGRKSPAPPKVCFFLGCPHTLRRKKNTFLWYTFGSLATSQKHGWQLCVGQHFLGYFLKNVLLLY